MLERTCEDLVKVGEWLHRTVLSAGAEVLGQVA